MKQRRKERKKKRKKGQHTYFGDSSLYARNDDNATDDNATMQWTMRDASTRQRTTTKQWKG
jgi:hypothetical protein